MVTAPHSDNGRNQSTCIEKGKPKNNNKIRQHEINKPIFHFPLSFFLVQSLFCLIVTIAIFFTVHHDNHQRRMRPALSPLPAAHSGGSSSNDSSWYREYLVVAACKSFSPVYAHQQLQRWIKTWLISPPPSPLPRNEGTINNQSLLSSWRLKLLSAYAMLPRQTHRCCRCHHHAAAALPNALLLPLKSRFSQAAASAAKLAAAAVLPPPPPPLPRCCHRRATTAYKIKNVILSTNLFFTTIVMAARSDDGGATRQQW
jgi:hypothetical protein